jgi:cyanophycinase
MSKSDSTLIAIGGGELAESPHVLGEITKILRKRPAALMVVMTVATNDPGEAGAKYDHLFRKEGFKHVSSVDVSQRNDAFNERSLERIRDADIVFFTGGDQLNITSLMGGSPLHNLLHEKHKQGFIIAGSSAGAAMMSSSMIISGKSDSAPRVGGVEIAPGMELVDGTIIDTHFTQRGRHGRLLTAVAHYPQAVGLGIDERTALVFNDGEMKVVGEGVVTVFDGSKMTQCDLPYRKDGETVGMFDARIHVLPENYKYLLHDRQPIAPKLAKMAGESDGN